jgi:hypothetical protein
MDDEGVPECEDTNQATTLEAEGDTDGDTSFDPKGRI